MRTTFKSKTVIRLVVMLAVILASSLAGAAQPEKVKLIVSTDIENFVKDLNDNGKAGYRLENSLSFGGEGPTQSYAAVLRLDAPNKYEYDWMSSPDKKLLEGRLNFQAKNGFNFANAYAITYCSDGPSNEPTHETLVLRLHKGDAFLLERRNGETDQKREYKTFIAKVRLGDSAEKDIQADLDAAAPLGFRPVKILFARQGLLDFSITVLAERNLADHNGPKTEYRFLKKSSGLPEKVNEFAAQGFRFITGRRVGLIGLALMDKQATDATRYTFIDRKKYEKEFDKTIALGNSYRGVMLGDLTCGSTEAQNERLVFEQNSSGKKSEYLIKTVAFTRTGGADPASLNEFQRLVANNYQIKDLFYSEGLKVIFEK
jgi:hypothetical protein